MPPSFGVKYFLLRYYLSIIIISFKRLPRKHFIPFLVFGASGSSIRNLYPGGNHFINTSAYSFPLFFTASAPEPFPPLLKNSSAPPLPDLRPYPSQAPKAPPRFCRWLPSLRSPRYSDPPFFCAVISICGL